MHNVTWWYVIILKIQYNLKITKSISCKYYIIIFSTISSKIQIKIYSVKNP